MVYTIYMMKKEIVMKVEDWVEQISKYGEKIREHGDHYALGVLSGCLEDMLKAKEKNCEWWENSITETSKVILEAYKRVYNSH
jgi:hypothetical protein